MDKPKKKLWTFTMAALLLAWIFVLYNSSSTFSTLLSLSQKLPYCQLNLTSTDAYRDALDSALAKANMGNKTVIIAVVNKAYVDQDVVSDTTMFDLFLNSFWLGEGTRYLIDHLLVVAVDRTAYDRCQFQRLNCYRLETDGIDFEGEKIYMSEDFIKMMWRRTLFTLEVLKRGYSFIYTDIDVMWLRNPFPKLNIKSDTEDMKMSVDGYLGNPFSEKHAINTGFYFVKSNNKTISLFQTWYNKKDNSTGQKEQDVLQDIIRGGIIGRLGLKVRFLSTLYFSGFCEDSKDFRVVTTVHANCCLTIAAKVADLRAALRDWKQFRRLDANSSKSLQWTRHDWCLHSWETNG